jgi:hypothetical protein
MSDETNWGELEAGFKAIAESSIAYFTAPRFAPKILTGKLGVPRTTLNNWLTNKEFDLDADRHRKGRETRLFSARDSVLLAAAAQFGAVGVPLAVAKGIASTVCTQIVWSLSHVQMSTARSELIIFRDSDHSWHVGPKSQAPDKLPPLRMEFDTIAFAGQVLGELGIPFVLGTADDLRSAADALDAKAPQ